MEAFENCVYTIIQSQKINDMIRNNESEYIEKKLWRTAYSFLLEAKKKNQILYLVLAPAESTIYLYAYAKIENIEILDTEKSTKITFSELRRFTNEDILKTELIKTNGEPVDENYIRPYLLCKTSSIQKYIDEEPKIPILDLTEEQFSLPLADKSFLSETELKAIDFACSKDDCIFSAKELADYLNYKDYNAANLLIGNIGKKIADYYSVDLSRKSNSPGWWRVFCDGGYIDGDDEFHWQIKNEFLQALIKTDWIEDFETFISADETEEENNELLQTEFVEGSKKATLTNRYERNKDARQACIKYYGAVCYVCGFDFEKSYGEIGKGFIHVHHEVDISLIGNEYKVDPIKDLKPVCPNCHAMLHQKRPAYTVEELKNIMKNT